VISLVGLFATPTPPPPTPTPAPVAISSPAPDAGGDRIWVSASEGIRENVVTTVAVDPADPKVVLAASSRGRIYRSEDAGRSWAESFRIHISRASSDSEEIAGEIVEDDLTAADLDELDQLREDTIAELVEELTPEVGADEAQSEAEDQADEIVEDRKAELQAQNRERQSQADEAEEDVPASRRGAVRQIVFDPSYPDLVWAVTLDGLWRSPDGGDNFVQVPVGVGDTDRDLVGIAVGVGQPDRLIVESVSGVQISDDGGGSWAQAQGEVGTTEGRAVALDPDDRSKVAVATADGAFVSIDAGQTWTKIWAGSGTSSDVRAIAFVPGPSVAVYVGTANGLWSVSGDQQTPLGVAQFESSSIRSLIAPVADPSRLYVATAKGVYESRDGGENFAELYRGLTSEDVIALAEDPTTPVEGLWAATALGLFRLRPDRYGLVALGPRDERGKRITDLVRAAERYGIYDERSLHSWRNAAKVAPYLPLLTATLRGGYAANATVNGTPVLNTSGQQVGLLRTPVSWDDNGNPELIVVATWNFDRLLFGTDKARLSTELATLSRARGKRLSKVARLAREREEIAEQLAALPEDEADERNDLKIRFQELTGYLDAATGGAASKNDRTEVKP
jgi:photosystem II stability/assembly factor-like uncharacterized protein